jgi:hypothetical protein
MVDGTTTRTGGRAVQLAVFGNQRATLPPDWTRETAVSILGDVRLDASAGAGPDAKLTFIGILGDLTVMVSTATKVRTSGFTIFGDPRLEVSQGGGPEVSVQSFSLFGDVTITDQSA